MEQQDLISLAADIVAAHVANNRVAVGDLPTLIRNVHGTLAGLQPAPAEPEADDKKPLVSVRASVKPDYLVCMECGRRHKTLKRHLAAAHGLTPAQYREAHGLPAGYPMVARSFADQRRALAQAIGLGRKAEGTGKSRSAGRPKRARPAKRAGGA